MEDSKYIIHQSIDNPRRIIFFTLDEAIIPGFSLIVGVIFNYAWIGLACAVILLMAIRKLKQGEGPYWPLYLIYWYLPAFLSALFLKCTPQSSYRQWRS